MAGIIGSGGQITLTLGSDTRAIGELLQFRVDLNRTRLDTTTQADEDTTLTGGRRTSRGSFEFLTRFYDSSECWSSYQLLEHLLDNEDDNVLMYADFRVQGSSHSCDDYRDSVYLSGTIIVDMSLDLQYDELVRSFANWQSSGPMQLRRAG